MGQATTVVSAKCKTGGRQTKAPIRCRGRGKKKPAAKQKYRGTKVSDPGSRGEPGISKKGWDTGGAIPPHAWSWEDIGKRGDPMGK